MSDSGKVICLIPLGKMFEPYAPGDPSKPASIRGLLSWTYWEGFSMKFKKSSSFHKSRLGTNSLLCKVSLYAFSLYSLLEAISKLKTI